MRTGGSGALAAIGGGSATGSSTGSMTGGATTSTGGSSTTGGSGASISATGASGAGAAGLIVLTRRGGPSTGAAGFGGSAAFLAGDAFFPPFAGGAGVSANMSPPGSATLRWRATRSTNERATTSSTVLEALFSSMP